MENSYVCRACESAKEDVETAEMFVDDIGLWYVGCPKCNNYFSDLNLKKAVKCGTNLLKGVVRIKYESFIKGIDKERTNGYFAVDRDNKAHFYTDKPDLDIKIGKWISNHEFYPVFTKIDPVEDWTTTLRDFSKPKLSGEGV